MIEVRRSQTAATEFQDPSTVLRMTMPSALSLHSVEGFLEDLEIAGVPSLLTSVLDPFLFQRVFGRAIGFVEHTEDAGERKLREFVGGELVGDVVSELVLGCAVPFLFLDHFKAAALLRIGWIEYVGEKFDAFAQAFDNAEALVVHRALDQLD